MLKYLHAAADKQSVYLEAKMKIYGKLQYGIDTTEQSARKQNVENNASDKSASVKNAAAAPKQDAVEISGKVKESVSIAKQLKELPDVRSEKVADLKAQIENGTYNVSGKDIAGKIVDSAVRGLF